MERDGRSRVITFFVDGPLAAGARIRMSGEAARHARARRVRTGEMARVLNGHGAIGDGRFVEVGRDEVTVSLTSVVDTAAPLPLEVIVPVADRDRMLFAAEKCAELQVTGWRPAYYARSRSVSPRGEGEKFRAKVVARMQSGLEQSGNAWMPTTHEERDVDEVMDAVPSGWRRVLLDSSGTSLLPHISNVPMALAIGPEGGLEPREVETARSRGWVIASLGPTTLRFETAIIAAVSVVRALQHPSESPQHG